VLTNTRELTEIKPQELWKKFAEVVIDRSRVNYNVNIMNITASINEFFEVKKGIENAIKSTKFITKFCTLKSVIKLELF
jgi:hypothetical protein